MKLYEITGTYGRQQTPCTVFCAEKYNGLTWYAVDGSQNVNLSPSPLGEGQDVETIADVDAFTWPDGVNSLEELETAIEA